MTKTKTWLRKGAVVALAGLTVLAVALVPRVARAAGPGPGGEFGGRPMGRFMHQQQGQWRQLRHELDLKPEQQKQIREVLAKHREELRATMKAVVEQRRQVAAATKAEPLDEQAVRTAVQGLVEPLTQAALLKAKVLAELKPILTADQLQKLQAQRQRSAGALDKLLSGAVQ